MPLIAKLTSVSRLSSCTDAILRMAASTHCGRELLRNNLWTEEACYSRDSVFIAHLWVRDNPPATRKHGYQIRFSVSIWATIAGDIAVGPHVLNKSMHARRYRDFLETVILDLLEDMPLAVRWELWFQYNGAPARYGKGVRKLLKATCPGR
jgi:hypothetical protein